MPGSDLIVRQLAALGIDHLSLNPGATLRGLHESLLDDGGIATMTTLHEAIAVGIAHGYAKASGRPMAVGLHDTVGVLNASLAIFNAWVDHVPMLILGGAGPLDPAARRAWIDWVHTTTDTPRPIRDFLVWAETPTTLAGALEALRRAHQRACSDPSGPAFVGLDVALQELPGDPADAIPGGALQPWSLSADPAHIGRAAEMLRSARSPVVVTDRPLTTPAADAAVRLAERLDASLLELEGAANVPVGHRLDRTPDAASIVAAADVLLLIDVRDSGLVLRDVRVDPPPEIIEAGLAPLRAPTWVVADSGVGDGLRLAGDPALTLTALLEAVTVDRSDPTGSRGMDRTSPSVLDTLPQGSMVDKRMIAWAAGSVLPHDRVVVAHGSLAGHARTQLRLREPWQYLGRSGGEGLGYALPGSLGVALANRGTDRVVVAFLTDGDTLYLPGALWTAAHEGIPLLAIVENDRAYGRDAIHQHHIAVARGRDPAVAISGVQLISPAVDITAMARAFGVEASDPVDGPDALVEALRTGLEVISGGRPFLVEARRA